jgi:hypothetical protein
MSWNAIERLRAETSELVSSSRWRSGLLSAQRT